MKNRSTLLVAGLFVLVASCGSSPEQVISGTSDTDAEPAKFTDARQTWETHSGGYTMTYISPCGESAFFTDVDTTVEVAADGATAIITGPDVSPLTVELIFEQIDGALTEAADVVEVTYSDSGYPITTNIDWEINSLDDEFCPTITNLEQN